MRRADPAGRSILAALAVLLASSAAIAGPQATLHGRIGLTLEGLELADAGAIVVFLERLDDPGGAPATELPKVVVRQNRARFDPPFLVVARGQPVEMPNDDVIFHNVFSYSEPNDFDLGIYPSGQSRTLRFEHPGLVRIYCSIHESMDGLIFVAPSRLFARPERDGSYAIPDIAPGRYRLHVWSERLPEIQRTLELAGGADRRLDVSIGLPDDRGR